MVEREEPGSTVRAAPIARQWRSGQLLRAPKFTRNWPAPEGPFRLASTSLFLGQCESITATQSTPAERCRPDLVNEVQRQDP